MQKLFKSLDFKPDSLDEAGCFTGYASVFNIEDSYHDVILPGAYAEALHRKIKLLWQHDVTKPIGRITKIYEDNKGLFMQAKLDLNSKYGSEAYTLLKSKSIDGLSIGFVVKDSYYGDEDYIRYIKAVDLYEISVVTFPANKESTVIEVKDNNLELIEFTKALDRAIEAVSSALK